MTIRHHRQHCIGATQKQTPSMCFLLIRSIVSNWWQYITLVWQKKSFLLTSQWVAIVTMFLYLWGPGPHIPWCVPINSRCILLAYFDIVREKECAICERKLTKCTKVYARISDKSKWDLSVDDGRVNAFSEKKFISNNWHILKTCWPTTSLYQPTFEMF